MTSQKRKSSLPGTTAKRPKLNEESQCPAVITRTRNGVANKSNNSTQFSTQTKNNNKSPANKAIRKSNLSQSEKKANVKVTKKNTVKNVPTKEKVLCITKDLAALKRKTEKSPSSASKVVKKSTSRVAKTETRRRSAQNQTSKTKNQNKNGTRKKTECLKKKSILKNKTDLKPRHAKKIAKVTQKIAKNGDKQLKLNEQSKRSKQTSLNLKKQAPIVKTADKNTKVDCKKGSNQPPHTPQKLTSRRRTVDKPTKQTQQKSVVSVLSKKNSKNTEIEVTKRLTLRTRVKADHVKGESETTPTVGVSLVTEKEKKAQSRALSNKATKKEVSVNGQSGSSSTNSSNKIATKSKTKAVSSGVPLKSKRDRTKPVVKAARNKLKNHKDVKTETDNDRPVTSAAEDQKSKRISILELCNEIAGEIESDTVEVAREVPSVLNIPVQESLVENSEHSAVEVLPSCPALVNQSKRFFPSRKPPQLKCKREQKTSPGIKNYKWNKIKLKKNFAENNILRNPAVLPNLEMIRAKISPVQQSVTNVFNDPKSPSKNSDSTMTTHLKLNKTVLSRMVKNNGLQTMVPRNVSENPSTENGLLENHIKNELEFALDEGFRLHLDSSPENSPMKQPSMPSSSLEVKPPGNDCKQLTHQMAAPAETGKPGENQLMAPKSKPLVSEQSIQKEIRKLREADKASNSNSQPIIDAGQKRIGAISCHVCGMLYTASNPEDETQHLLFHNQFISAVRYVGWKKERIVAEYPDGKIIMVLPDDPKYALKKVEEIREMVDNDLGFQQVPLQLHSRTKTLLFISSDKKVVGCLIAEHIQWGYRVIDDFTPSGSSDKDQLISERVKAWCCSITPEPAICGVSRIWVFSMMRRKKIASRLLECLRSHFIYGSHLSKDEIAFSDPTPDGKLFATHYCGTSQFLVYNFVSGHQGS